eukprot:549367_1
MSDLTRCAIPMGPNKLVAPYNFATFPDINPLKSNPKNPCTKSPCQQVHDAKVPKKPKQKKEHQPIVSSAHQSVYQANTVYSTNPYNPYYSMYPYLAYQSPHVVPRIYKSPFDIVKDFERKNPVSLQRQKQNRLRYHSVLNVKRIKQKSIQNKTQTSTHARTAIHAPETSKIKNVTTTLSPARWNEIRDTFDHSSYHFEPIYHNPYGSPELNELFKKIHPNGLQKQETNLSNYVFLKESFPSRVCEECNSALMVIVLCHLGECCIEDEHGANRTVGLYKICALCSKYPNCLFPLSQSTYFEYWIASAYFDDQKATMVRKPRKKRRRLNDDVGGRSNHNKRKNDEVKDHDVNSYDYLQSLVKGD